MGPSDTFTTIRHSDRIGAFIAGASAEKLELLTIYGERVGLAFQIIDDILDITGTKDELGKPIGSDSLSGKNTYPSLFGLDESINISNLGARFDGIRY